MRGLLEQRGRTIKVELEYRVPPTRFGRPYGRFWAAEPAGAVEPDVEAQLVLEEGGCAEVIVFFVEDERSGRLRGVGPPAGFSATTVDVPYVGLPVLLLERNPMPERRSLPTSIGER